MSTGGDPLNLYLVSEIEPVTRLPAGLDDETPQKDLMATPLGCYVAKSPEAACRKAAKQARRAGNFAAVEAKMFKVDFETVEFTRAEMDALKQGRTTGG
jgi:hypothetical protein